MMAQEKIKEFDSNEVKKRIVQSRVRCGNRWQTSIL
jgi:hypothetical protein